LLWKTRGWGGGEDVVREGACGGGGGRARHTLTQRTHPVIVWICVSVVTETNVSRVKANLTLIALARGAIRTPPPPDAFTSCVVLTLLPRSTAW